MPGHGFSPKPPQLHGTGPNSLTLTYLELHLNSNARSSGTAVSPSFVLSPNMDNIVAFGVKSMELPWVPVLGVPDPNKRYYVYCNLMGRTKRNSHTPFGATSVLTSVRVGPIDTTAFIDTHYIAWHDVEEGQHYPSQRLELDFQLRDEDYQKISVIENGGWNITIALLLKNDEGSEKSSQFGDDFGLIK